MTPPRFVQQGQLSFVTCEAVSQAFRFLPTRWVVEMIWFVFAVMVSRFGIEVHEVFFMSNHFHVLLTDRRGVLPDFMRDLNSLMSRGLNALRGSTGTNIEKNYNVVTPIDERRVVEHSVYTLANACKADLVARAREWEGVSSLALEYGKPVTFRRPTVGLWAKVAAALEQLRALLPGQSKGRLRWAGRTTMPESVEFTLVRPPVMNELSDEQLRQAIRDDVTRAEDQFIAERTEHGRSVLGMERVLRQAYTDTPKTSRVLFQTTPRVSGKSRRARVEAVVRRLDFEKAHATARDAIAEVLANAKQLGKRLAAELRKIQIPDGSWLLRKRYALACAQHE